MRYIDTGSREPDQALGSWLTSELADSEDVAALRWQSGLFGGGVLGYFAATFAALRSHAGLLRVLVGSNDGTTRRADVERLVEAAGPSRPDQELAVVSFDSGYFHPKVLHLARTDGSACAYIGSANLTESGVSGLHIEAGLVLDTRTGDDPAVLGAVADAVDWWFAARPPGMFVVAGDKDLNRLVASRILDVPKPPPARGQSGGSGDARPVGARLSSLVATPLPAVPVPPPAEVPLRGQASTQRAAAAPASAVTVVARWEKALTQSDAQRKPTGHQRGSITLVGGQPKVETRRYFRFDFFGQASWAQQHTRTGRVRESAIIPFSVIIGRRTIGLHTLLVTYAPNRESGQNNYTSLLHLGPLAPYFARANLQDRTLSLERTAEGTYHLSIT
jgi:hypothetical protein